MRRARWLGALSCTARRSAVTATSMAPRRRARAAAVFELARELLVRPAHQRGAVPHAAVGIGVERRGERLVHTAALLHAGALPDRGAHQRVPETDGVDVEVDERRLDGRLQRVEIQRCPGDGAGGLEDLACGLAVAERGDQQDKASGIGQIGDASRRRRAQGARSAAGRPAPTPRPRAGRSPPAVQEEPGVSGGLTQHAVACGKRKVRGRCVQ